MSVKSTAVVTKTISDVLVVQTVDAIDVPTFVADGWALGIAGISAVALEPLESLLLLTRKQLEEIAAECSVFDIPSFTTKTLLATEILRVKGLISYT